MRSEAREAAGRFAEEVERIKRGLQQLRGDPVFFRAFTLMNAAFERASTRYDRWRPFQVGFLLSVLPSIHPSTREAEAEIVDTLWFATGGGKTETYLAILVMAAFHDRLLSLGSLPLPALLQRRLEQPAPKAPRALGVVGGELDQCGAGWRHFDLDRTATLVIQLV